MRFHCTILAITRFYCTINIIHFTSSGSHHMQLKSKFIQSTLPKSNSHKLNNRPSRRSPQVPSPLHSIIFNPSQVEPSPSRSHPLSLKKYDFGKVDCMYTILVYNSYNSDSIQSIFYRHKRLTTTLTFVINCKHPYCNTY